MKENQNKPKSENLVHFDSFEETVIRGNSPEKEAVKKVLKKKYALIKLRQLVSIISAFAVLVSAFFLGKRGFESYLVRTQEQKEEAEDMKKTEEIGNMKISEVKVKVLHKRCTDEGVDEAKVLSLYKVSDFSELTEKKFHNIVENWAKIKEM